MNPPQAGLKSSWQIIEEPKMSETAAGTIAQLAWTVGPWQIVLILVVILLLFGGKRLPELARGLARGLREFRSELKGIKKDVEEEPEAKEPGEKSKPPADDARAKDTAEKPDDEEKAE